MPDLYSKMMTAENEFKTSTSQRLRFLCCPTVTLSSCNLPHITVLASISPALIRIQANLIELENSSTANALLQTKILDLSGSLVSLDTPFGPAGADISEHTLVAYLNKRYP